MPLMLGRKPRTYKPMLHWSSLKHMRTVAAPIPSKHNWLNLMPANFGMMANGPDPQNPLRESGGVGDCVCALMGHALQVWSFNARAAGELTITTPDVLKVYESECGFVPSQPSTDQGCEEQAVFNDWYSKGVALPSGSLNKLLIPPIELDVTNFPDICEAIYQCGVVGIGFNMPAYIMESYPTVWPLDPTADQTIVGSHGVILAGFNKPKRIFNVVSWGNGSYRMKFGFLQQFADEAYAFVNPTWVEQTGKTPLGLTAAQLEALAPTL